MKMKKWTTLIIAMMMILSLAVGCGSQNGENADFSQSQNETLPLREEKGRQKKYS